MRRPEHLHPDAARLGAPTPLPRAFDPGDLDDLPGPVRRWLLAAIEPGAPLLLTARLQMHGEIKFARWMPFHADQVLSPDGFVWSAHAGRFPMRISGFDRCSDGTGEMRWKLGGLIPVMSAVGEDTTRSAAGRLAGESMLVPAGALAPGVDWDSAGVDDRHATATVSTGPFRHRVTVEIGRDGALRSVSLPRWGNPDGGPHEEIVFGVLMDGSIDVSGQRIPSTLRAGWWFGSDRFADGEFFRATIDHVELS